MPSDPYTTQVRGDRPEQQAVATSKDPLAAGMVRRLVASIERQIEGSEQMATQTFEALMAHPKAFDTSRTDAAARISVEYYVADKHARELLAIMTLHGMGAVEGSRIIINPVAATIPMLGRDATGDRSSTPRKYAYTERMSITEMFMAVDADSHLTFEYRAMTVTASVIAAVGLVTDEAVTIVASMLIPRLMSPILSVTFGISVRRSEMIRRGVRNEVLGFLICFLVGLVAGGMFGWIDEIDWTGSVQISSRGQLSGLISGSVVAIASGAGGRLMPVCLAPMQMHQPCSHLNTSVLHLNAHWPSGRHRTLGSEQGGLAGVSREGHRTSWPSSLYTTRANH